jgi:hypothetical protein
MSDSDEDLDLDLRMANRQARTRFFVGRAVRQSRAPRPIREMSPRGIYVPPPDARSRGTVVKLWSTKATTTAAYSRYLERGKGIDGQDATLFGPTAEVDRHRFAARAQEDSHQFRFIMSLAPHIPISWVSLTQRLLHVVSHDLRTRLDWLAAVHHDTAYQHVHVQLRARTDDGQPLYLTKDYWTHGLRFRTQQMATAMLGRLSPAEVTRERLELAVIARDITQPRSLAPRVLTPAQVMERLAETQACVERFKAQMEHRRERHQTTHHGIEQGGHR